MGLPRNARPAGLAGREGRCCYTNHLRDKQNSYRPQPGRSGRLADRQVTLMDPQDRLPFEKEIYEMEELLARLEVKQGPGAGEEVRRIRRELVNLKQQDLQQPDRLANRPGFPPPGSVRSSWTTST